MEFGKTAISSSSSYSVASAVYGKRIRELSNEGRGRDAIKHEAQPSALSPSRPRSEFDNSCTARAKVF